MGKTGQKIRAKPSGLNDIGLKMPKEKDSRSGQSKAWRVQLDKRHPKSRTTNQAKPGGLSKIEAQSTGQKISEKPSSLPPDRPHAEACARVRRRAKTAKNEKMKI